MMNIRKICYVLWQCFMAAVIIAGIAAFAVGFSKADAVQTHDYQGAVLVQQDIKNHGQAVV